MKGSLLFLSLFVAANALTEFTLPVTFSNGVGPSVSLVVDTMFTQSFVLGREWFGEKAGRGKTYDPAQSKYSKRIDYWRAHSYSNGEIYGTVSGAIYSDRVGSFPDDVEASFLVGQELDRGYPAKNLNGTYVAGHLGIAREKDGPTQTNLADKVLAQTENKVWCGEAIRSSQRYLQRSILGILPQDHQIVTRIPSKEYIRDWALTGRNVTTSGKALVPGARIAISSVVDKILFPRDNFSKAVRLFEATRVGERYKVDCNGNYDIDFVAGGQDVRIESVDLVEKEGEECFLKIGLSLDELFYFGLPFFANRGICFNFDLDEIILYNPIL
ncbi:unnamed protein product [Bursaphelenchus xylophilus]|uniref:(pine wood nematode) hypothetical protein n=1 Tax=Bursaphelenchus xylophilus TaxID=6326 RepID=A0A1I7SAZ8_BURXY|nr:unnamed protein product [Bursaphelenchus xylophilus]CAG9105994.1 unnamed protein product [Bursaphelenchus xylophilus]